ncbi:Nucleotidyltransferase [Linderina pennispora]|uniref:polynucleotide adenylyltransferase n=1 Tax=Linderina pennispora TaxID=61395 RepID=A0A1Y1W6I6_9FUNG|nr:Nucleotidyltransferase [Linderina pennispora]ORX69167.1 Nucleotidyltransferase [Linderina pennispora]
MSRPSKETGEDYIGLAESSSESEVSDTEPAPVVAGTKRKAPEDDLEDSEALPAATTYEKCYNGQPLPPWLHGKQRLGKGSKPAISDMLNEEVKDFVDFISPTGEERQMRQWVIDRIQRVLDGLKMVGVEAKAFCFGSFSTNLFLPTSDIDMTVMIYDKGTTRVASRYATKDSVRKFLYTLAHELKRSTFASKCEVIAKARVPIIKTHENVTGYAVDISVNADSGLGSARVQKSFSEHVYPKTLRSIVLVIKQCTPGGLGSYAITLLVVSFLQNHPRVRSGGLDLYENMGVLLTEFFELYGKRFNYDNVGISVRDSGNYFDKRSRNMLNVGQPYLLAIEDPCDETNDVTKGTYGISRIKQTFAGAYDLLNNAIYAYHQTRKFGEPINSTLKATAVPEQPGSKRSKNNKGGKSNRKSAKLFNDDPWAPVSFLSSILKVNQSVVTARQRIIATFHKGTMQRILGVSYNPVIVNLAEGDSNGIGSVSAPASNPPSNPPSAPPTAPVSEPENDAEVISDDGDDGDDGYDSVDSQEADDLRMLQQAFGNTTKDPIVIPSDSDFEE